jgi:hypothetical protein
MAGDAIVRLKIDSGLSHRLSAVLRRAYHTGLSKLVARKISGGGKVRYSDRIGEEE